MGTQWVLTDYIYYMYYAVTVGEYGDPGRTRTCDIRFRKPMLYPAELRGLLFLNYFTLSKRKLFEYDLGWCLRIFGEFKLYGILLLSAYATASSLLLNLSLI